MKGLLGLAGLSGPSSLLCEGSEAGPFKVGWANPESGFWIQTSIQQNKYVYKLPSLKQQVINLELIILFNERKRFKIGTL